MKPMFSFGRICNEIVRSWSAFEAYFRSESECPKFLRKIFSDESTLPSLEYKTIFQFLSFILGIFNRFNLISQTPSLPFPQLIKSLNGLKTHLQLSLEEKDFWEATMILMEEIEQEGGSEILQKLKESFMQFYENTLDYLEKWTVHLDEINEFAPDWLIFEEPPTVQKIKSAYRKYCSKKSQDLDELFIEIGSLKSQLERLNQTAFKEISVDDKWSTIFKDPSFVHLKKIVSILLSIFSSNVYCESVFSVVKNVKTNERNRMKAKLLNSLVSIKLNCDLSCIQAYDLFISDPDLLNLVKNSEKYAE